MDDLAVRRERSALHCWYCAHPIAPDDRYCAHCAQGQGAHLQWYYRPLWIAVLAMTVLGPFVLPIVWRTPRLDRTGKTIATLLVLAITAYVGWQLWSAVQNLETVLGG
jgi:hypothetical protein